MEHIHTLEWVKRTPHINCTGCDLRLRFATYTEAVYIYDHDAFAPDGPMVFSTSGSIAVPLDYQCPVNYVKEQQ